MDTTSVMEKEMSSPSQARHYFICMTEPGVIGPRQSIVLGAHGANDLQWHVRDSVNDLISEPVRYRSQYEESEPLPDLLRHNDVLVVSQRLREAIEPWLKDYEFIPVEIELYWKREGYDLGGGPLVRDYWWLNCWRRLDLIDWEKSEVTWSLPQPPGSEYEHSPVKAISWKQLVLKESAPEGEHFFGLAHMAGQRNYLSEDLHRSILRLRLGVKFEPRMLNKGHWSAAINIVARLNKPD